MRYSGDINELNLTNRLPSPSGTVLSLIRLMQDENTGIQEVARLLQTDPALSAKILRVANSASVGSKRPVVDIQKAAVLMGMQSLRNLALGFSIIGDYRQGKCQNFDYSSYWAESLAQAVALHAVSFLEAVVLPEEAFTFGLLFEIGRLAMATAWPEQYSACLAVADDSGELVAFENEKFSIDSQALGLWLLESWGFPKLYLDAYCHYKQKKSIGHHRVELFSAQIQFACEISTYLIADKNDSDDIAAELVSMGNIYGLDEVSLSAFLLKIKLEWQEWLKLTGIRIRSQGNRRTIDRASSVALPAEAKDRLCREIKLLVVNADSTWVENFAQHLNHNDYIIDACADCESAIGYVVNNKPDIVIIDESIESKTGVEFCKALRSFEAGSSCYSIVITEKIGENALVQAFKAGFDDHVVKPVSLPILSARVEAAKRMLLLQRKMIQRCEQFEQTSTELAVANRQLFFQANTDALTGLPNRRYGLDQLECQFALAARMEKKMGLLLLDLDYFKSINDNFGHDTGDKVLAHTAKIIRDSIRVNDTACRWGGEEFLVIIDDADCETAVFLAERLRYEVEINPYIIEQQKLAVTVSVGVSVGGGKRLSWPQLLKKADKALYKVKQSTRNAVSFAS